MALVKVVRDTPEFVGGPVTAMVPETALNDALFNGWKVSEEKPVKETKEPVKEEPKVETPKVEEKKPKKTL